MKKVDFTFVLAAVLAIGLPLLGVVMDGQPVSQYMEFPPLTRYVEHSGFSWLMFFGLAIFILVFVVPFLLRVVSSVIRFSASPVQLIPVSFFPWWGWLGLILGSVAWTLAWTRFEWFARFQLFTFSPLWISFILVVNAVTFRRTGRCMLINRTGYFLKLFPLSAAFWWFFEYLNRFVQNWYYHGVDGLSSFQYFIFATLPFSTVLPAVLGTYELLKSFPILSGGLEDSFRLNIKHARGMAVIALLLFGFGLAGIGVWPDYLFPLLWISPLGIITALQAARGQETIFAPVRTGNWRQIFLLAISALMCGCFWEMWNYYSVAKWLYAVPFVGRFHIFEMPILGFAGYLPFGLECAVIATLVSDGEETNPSVTGKEAAMNNGNKAQGDVYNVFRNHFLVGWCKLVNTVVVLGLAVYFFIVPGFIILKEVGKSDIRKPGVPAIAWKIHRDISQKFASWARERVASGRAAHLQLVDVPSTEWPMFGCVFYLMATENLQREWDKDNNLAPVAPRQYARDAVEAAIELIMDPVHHTWVKQHWGPDYLHRENVFFRSLLIRGITSHEKIMKNGKYLDVLKDQVITLAAELDKSKFGILDDYPSECYPIDVLASIAWMKSAGQLLGIDNSRFIERSIRAFEGKMLDERGLPLFLMDSWTGTREPEYFGARYRCSRGTGNSWVLIFVRDLWPGVAEQWYSFYERYFWQDKWWADGFREFPNDIPGLDYTYDVDSGPIVAGFSPAANAFGVAMARANGRFDHAYILTAQVLAACWPLADGTFLGARILSNQAHAPYLGESAICYFFTQQPVADARIVTGGHMPVFVFILVIFYYWGIGLTLICSTISGVRKWSNDKVVSVVPVEYLQVLIWVLFCLSGLTAVFSGHIGAGILLLLLAQFLPGYRKTKCGIGSNRS